MEPVKRGKYTNTHMEELLDEAIAAARHHEGLFHEELALRCKLEAALSEIIERFETKQALHKDDCFAYKVASKALNALGESR